MRIIKLFIAFTSIVLLFGCQENKNLITAEEYVKNFYDSTNYDFAQSAMLEEGADFSFLDVILETNSDYHSDEIGISGRLISLLTEIVTLEVSLEILEESFFEVEGIKGTEVVGYKILVDKSDSFLEIYGHVVFSSGSNIMIGHNVVSMRPQTNYLRECYEETDTYTFSTTFAECKKDITLTNILTEHLFDDESSVTIITNTIEEFLRLNVSNQTTNTYVFDLYSLINEKTFNTVDKIEGEILYDFDVRSGRDSLRFRVSKTCDDTCDYNLYSTLNMSNGLLLAEGDSLNSHLILSTLLVNRGIFINEYTVVSSFEQYKLYMITIPMDSPGNENRDLYIDSEDTLGTKICTVIYDEDGKVLGEECFIDRIYSSVTSLSYNRDYIQLKYYIMDGDILIDFGSVSKEIPVEVIKNLVKSHNKDFITILIINE